LDKTRLLPGEFILQHAENSHGLRKKLHLGTNLRKEGPPCFLNGALLLPVPLEKKKALKTENELSGFESRIE